MGLNISVKSELIRTLDRIDRNLHSTTSDEEQAILLLAKANALHALQKYE